MNHELKITWKEAAEVTAQLLLGVTEENHRKSLSEYAVTPAEIQTEHFPNTSLECYR
jgi:hypothetical protein